jgi:Cation transporting ATPase, C-terminus
MTFFGPISSIFDFATFGIMIWVFNAHAPLFRSGWFVESLATQSLIIFAIRTHRVPFFHSTPSRPLALAITICVGIGVLLPFSPLAHVLGFVPLPAGFLAALAVMIVIYLVPVELGSSASTAPGRTARPSLAAGPNANTGSIPRHALEHPRPSAPPNPRRVLGVDPEICLQRHLDVDTFGHVHKRSTGPYGAVERRELVVVGRDDRREVLTHDVLVLSQRRVHVGEDHPLPLEVLVDLEVDDL